MELTIEQTLLSGVAAHNAGKLEEAERLYRAILQSHPAHPDANHNLGVIAVSFNKADLALPLFKTALEANPKIEQFWLSYIDALIKKKQFDNAKQVLEQAKKQGVSRDKVDAIEAQITTTTQVNEPKLVVQKKSLTLKEKRKKIAASKQQKKQAKGKNVNSLSPSQSQIDNLLEHYQNGRYDDAEKLAKSNTREFPKHQLAWKVLGAIFGQTDRKAEAVNANQISVALSPQDATAHYNLGITLQELGRLDAAEASYRKAIALKPDYAVAHSNLGVTLKELGRLNEAEASYTQAIAFKPDFAEAYSNLGITLQELGRLDEAEASCRQAIALKSDDAEAYGNLGITLKELGRLDEAEASYTQAIVLKPDFAEARYNLGNTLKELGRLDEALASYKKAIALKPDFAKARYNLGITLKELGRLDEAEASFTQAIALKPDYVEAHCNLGDTLQELGRLEEAEVRYNQAIALKPDLDLAHSGLGIVLYIKGNEDLAIKSIVKANEITPQEKDFELLLKFMEVRKSRKGNKAGIIDTSNITAIDTSNITALTGLVSSPLILNRVVEPELIISLYEMNSIQLDKTKRVGLLPAGKADARYGNGIASPDFNLFEDARPIIQKLAEDLTKIMMKALKSDIYIMDSFFNILGAGGGTTPHAHLSTLDTIIGLDIGKQKYSLVYYLSVGDQNCREPGILKLYEPGEDILPCEGMITIIPACRMHSAVYGGKTDRVMIGVNFYCL